MNFFEQQDKARSKTARLVIMFLIGIVGLAIIAFVAVFMGYILLIGDGYYVEEEAFSIAPVTYTHLTLPTTSCV